MESYELIKQGAEARIFTAKYKGKLSLVKERFEKKYRHPDLDKSLTKSRMKTECNALQKCCKNGLKVPEVYLCDFKNRKIIMEYFQDSISVKDYLELCTSSCNANKLCDAVGTMLASMHKIGVVHGDLTFSNMLLIDKEFATKCNVNGDHLVLIDFGLSHLQPSIEDMAVDLYVLERAMISSKDAQMDFDLILKAYQANYNNSDKVIKQLNEVRARGRKRVMVG